MVWCSINVCEWYEIVNEI